MCKNNAHHNTHDDIHCSLCQKRIRKGTASIVDETNNHVAHSCCADWAAGEGRGNGTSVCVDCGRTYIVAEHNFDEVRCTSCQLIAEDGGRDGVNDYYDSYANMLIGAYAYA